MEFNYKFIEELTQVHGISGHEEEVAKLLKSELQGNYDEYSFDNIGSIIFKKQGTKSSHKIMVAGHMDQIGFLVTDIDDNGFAYVKPIGGWWVTQLMTNEVIAKTEDGKFIPGVIGHKPSKDLSKKKEIEWTDIFIDFGVDNKEELLSYGIEIGTPIVPASEYTPLANPRYVATKAWDNRVGCAIGSEVMKNISKENFEGDLYFAGTVQEEVGIRGAKTASYKIRPDFAISIDIGGYGDTPGCKSYDSTLKLGKGPGIMFLDATCIGHKKFVKFAKEVAKKYDIPFQVDIMLNGGTDCGEMHKQYDGCAALTLSIPTRYGHSHNSIIHLDDLENASRLIKAICEELTEEKAKEIKSFE
ncbi:MAG: M42 family metallopeptidase [Clostridium sp.]